MAAPADGPDPEQDKWLVDANENVKKQGFLMKRALDNNNLRDALKHASAMIGELRTSKLSPKNYYDLYMNVTNELRELELFVEDEDEKERRGQGGRSIVDLYENVQHAGNIIPRLYLLITAGSVYIKSKKAPAKDILFDLVELCRGVQHPMRGLFLRDYLSQVSKNKLPDIGSEYEGGGGSVKDSIEFILQNFAEMNKLWVRMQHQGAVRERSRREKERRNLRQLVGINLVRLSEMSGVDLETYKEQVLPRVLEQIVNCKDVIAQEYLMDCVVQVFPDEFHLQTLETYLATCSQLQEGVNVKNIIITLMDRLSNYAKEAQGGISTDVEMFPLFQKYSTKIIQASPKMPLVDVLSLQVALVNFATKVYPEVLTYVDDVLGFSAGVLEGATKERSEKACVTHVVQLLSLPLDALALRILELKHYGPLMQSLELDNRKSVAVTILRAVLKAKATLDTIEKVEALYNYIAPLTRDEGEPKPVPESERFQFDQEQQLVARLFHLIHHPNTDEHFKLYSVARKQLGQGGNQRVELTLPPVVFAALELTKLVHVRETAGEEVVVKTKKMFGFVHESITVLSQPFPDLALRLFLQAATTADRLGYEAIAYEFVAQAFICYEDEISDSKQQFNSINLIIATLQSFSVFSQENYETLLGKATQHSAKLLKKTDQCRAVYNCSHLFWPGDDANPGHRDEKRVLACLQRALKIANACMGHQVHLFVEILNKYLYFFDRKCPSITVKYLKGLIALIEEHLPNMDNSEASRQAKVHYENTRRHIKLKQTVDAGDGERERYLAIDQEGDAE